MPQNFNDFYANQFALQDQMLPTVPTLAEQKAALLKQKAQQKLASLNPEAAADESAAKAYQELYGNQGTDLGDSNFIDAAQSSLYQTAGNLYDMGSNIYNRVSNDPYKKTDAIGKELDKWSDRNYANMKAGYDPTYADNAVKQAEEDVKQGHYLGAVGNYLKAAPDTLAGMTGMGLEFAAGAALTPATGGTSLLGIMGTLTTKAPKLAKAVKSFYSLAKDSTIVSADQANQQAEEYEKNTGHKKSIAAITSDFLTNAAINATTGETLKLIFKSGTLGTFKQSAGELMKTVDPRSNAAMTIVKNIAGNTLKVATAGVVGGAQMYLSTWHNILATHNKPLLEQLKNEENQNKALSSFVQGATLMGAIEFAPKALNTAAIGTLNTGKGVLKGTAKFAHTKLTKSNLKFMSQEQKDKIYTKWKESEEQHNNTIKANEDAAKRIENATDIRTLKSFQDPEVESAIDDVMSKDNKIKAYKKAIDEANDFKDLPKSTLLAGYIKDIQSEHKGDTELTFDEVKSKLIDKLNNSYKETDLNANLEKIKNKAIASYNEKNKSLQIARKYSQSKDIAGQVVANTYEASKKALNAVLPKETRDAIIEQASKGVDLAKVGLDMVIDETKHLNKSAARGVIDDIAKGKMNEVVASYSKDQLKELKKGFEENEKAKKLIDKLIEKRDKVKGEFDNYLEENKDKSVLDKLVDSYGSVTNTELAVKLRGLASITKDALTDSDKLSRYKKLVKDLKEEDAKNPEEFKANNGDKRLKKAYKVIAEAKKSNEQGLINDTYREIGRIYKKLTKSKNSKEIFNSAKNKLSEYKKDIEGMSQKVGESIEDYLQKIEDYDLESKVDKIIDDFVTKAEKNGVDTSDLKPIKETVKKEADTIKKEKNEQKSEVNSKDKPQKIDKEFRNLDFEDSSSIEKLLKKHSFDSNYIAKNLTYDQINQMINSKDPIISDYGDMFKKLKDELPLEDKEVSDLPDRTLTKNEMEDKKNIEIAKIICKE